MLHARLTAYVEVPHLTGHVLNTDEAIIAAYHKHPQKISPSVALRQARRGGVRYHWTIWNGDQPTDYVAISEHWCKEEIARRTSQAGDW